MAIDSDSADAEPRVAKRPEPACKILPPVNILSDVVKDPAPTPDDVATKWWVWSGVTNIGDCTMRDEMLTIRADGNANFYANVKSSDDDDQWVFNGGISLLDVHGVVLWTSPKLIGPPMEWENQWESWNEDFNYPVVWFDSAAGARINQAHC